MLSFSRLKIQQLLVHSSAGCISELYDKNGEFSVPDSGIDHGIFEYPNLKAPEDFTEFKRVHLEKCLDLQSTCNPSEVNSENLDEYLDVVDEISNCLCLYLDTTEFVRNNFENFFEISEEYFSTLKYLHHLNNDKNVFNTLLKILDVSESGAGLVTDEEELVINRLINDMQIPFSEESDELIRLNTKLDILVQQYNMSFDQNTLRDILLTRHEFAQRMNMDSYAHMEFNRDRHALETPDAVLGFLETLDYINRNYEPIPRALQLREGFDEMKVRWKIDEVLKGLDLISREIIGLTIKPAKMSQYEKWGPGVRKLTCHDTNNNDEMLGTIYLDLFDDEKKISMTSFPRLGKKKSGQLPICVARCRVDDLTSEDIEEGNIFLKYSDLRSFFHEIGHCFHSIIGQTEYQFISGSRSSRDTIEIPSIFMEYFLENFEVMERFSTNGDIKFTEDEFYHTVYNYHQYFYVSMTRKIQDSKLFLLLHHIPNEMLIDNVFSIESQHIVEYGPSYYTYLLSNVVAAQVYDQRFKDDPFNENRKGIIKNIFKGGSMYSSDKIDNMLGDQQINAIHVFDLTNV